MSVSLLLPAALGALAALLIPLLIHIARRTESRTVPFAALRWLEAQARPRRRPTLDERRLLTVRLLLLGLIVLFVAQPALWGAEDPRPVVGIAPGVARQAVEAPPGTRAVWLAPGFPTLSNAPPARASDVASMIRQLDAQLPPGAALTIVAPTVLDGMDAERPRLSRPVDWRIVKGAAFTAAPSVGPFGLTVRYAPDRQDGVRYLRAAAMAWTEPGLRPDFDAAPLDAPVDRNATHLAWLAPGPLPAPIVGWIENGGTVLIAHDARAPSGGEAVPIWRDAVGEPLAAARPLGRGRVVQLTRAMAPAANPALAEPDFPDALRRMLSPFRPPARVAAVDHAPLTGAKPYPQPPLDLRPWLALLIALLFVLERWMATRRGRAVAA